jgi:hypothetical protein
VRAQETVCALAVFAGTYHVRSGQGDTNVLLRQLVHGDGDGVRGVLHGVVVTEVQTSLAIHGDLRLPALQQ